MKVIIFGATGTVGRIAVRKMLEDGHQVTAFARRPETLEAEHPALRRHAGNALNASEVEKAIKGHDAVVIVLGAGMSRKGTIRSTGTLNVIQAMQAHGVKRLICQSTLGAHESWGNLNFFWKRIMFGVLLRPVFLDHELQENLIRASGLDWTIVRPSAFTDGPESASYKEGFSPEAKGLSLKISRADVAHFLARQVGEPRYLHQAVSISM